LAFNTRLAHGSTVAFPLAGTLVGASVGKTALVVANVVSRVGTAAGVSVAAGVFVGISVGGSGVAVGIAACVCAPFVNAAASAVCCTSTELTVGTGCAPHALMKMASRAISVKNVKCFMILGNSYDLAVGIATAIGYDLIIADCDLPTAFRNAETAEDFETLFPVDERAGAILSFGTF